MLAYIKVRTLFFIALCWVLKMGVCHEVPQPCLSRCLCAWRHSQLRLPTPSPWQPRTRLKVGGRMLAMTGQSLAGPALLVRHCQVLHFPPLRFDSSLSGLAFSTPTIWSIIVKSCIFHPYDLIRHCQVLHFLPLRFDPSLSDLAFSTPTIWFIIVRSCIFYPYDLIHHCQVLHFLPLRFDPSLSGLAFSTPTIWSIIVRSCIFRSCHLVHHCHCHCCVSSFALPSWYFLQKITLYIWICQRCPKYCRTR